VILSLYIVLKDFLKKDSWNLKTFCIFMEFLKKIIITSAWINILPN
jgi:hypothetical protein